MSTLIPRRTGVGLATVLLAVGAVSGCGVSDQRILPGSAADVGGTQIDSGAVDSAVPGACSFLVGTQGLSALPQIYIRQDVLVAYVQQAAAEDVVATQGVSVGTSDDIDLQGTDEGLSTSQVEATRDYLRAKQYVSDALLALSANLPDASPSTPVSGDPNAAVNDLQQRAYSTYLAPWLADHEIVLNPTFNLSLDDQGNFVSSDDGLSVPASDLAVGSAFTPDDPDVASKLQSLVARLPAAQLCGTPAPVEPVPAGPQPQSDVVPQPRPSS